MCNIEEVFSNGERSLLITNDNNSLRIDNSNFLALLIKFGSLNDLKNYFINYKLSEIEYFLQKNKIRYNLT